MNKELFVVAMLGFMLVMGGVFACEEYKPPTPVDDGCNVDQDQQQDQEQSQETDIDNTNTNTNDNDNKNTNTQGQSQNSDNKNTNNAQVVNSGNSVNTNVNTVVVDLDQFVSQMNKMNQKSAQVNYQEQFNSQEQITEANPVAKAGIIMVNGVPYCKTSDGKLCPCYVDGNGTLVVDAQTNATAVPMEETGGNLIPLAMGGILGGVGIVGATKAGWLGRFGM